MSCQISPRSPHRRFSPRPRSGKATDSHRMGATRFLAAGRRDSEACRKSRLRRHDWAGLHPLSSDPRAGSRAMNASQEVTFLLARRKLRDCDPAQIKDPDSFVPRIARLMALAIRLEGLVRDETVCDYAELAHLGRVTRARMTQIMKLLQLAP